MKSPFFVLGVVNFLMLSAFTVLLAVKAPGFIEAWFYLGCFWFGYGYVLSTSSKFRLILAEMMSRSSS